MIIIMIMPCYKNDILMMKVACDKRGKLMMTNLIIIKVKFVYFKKDEVGKSGVWSNARLCASSNDYRSCDYGVIKNYKKLILIVKK